MCGPCAAESFGTGPTGPGTASLPDLVPEGISKKWSSSVQAVPLYWLMISLTGLCFSLFLQFCQNIKFPHCSSFDSKVVRTGSQSVHNGISQAGRQGLKILIHAILRKMRTYDEGAMVLLRSFAEQLKQEFCFLQRYAGKQEIIKDEQIDV